MYNTSLKIARNCIVELPYIALYTIIVESLKERATQLRKSGHSYNMIKEKLGIPKSTLSNWLSKIPFVPNRELIKRIGVGKLKSALQKQNLKFASFKKANDDAEKDIGLLSKRDLFILGIGLYLGEGEKTYENVRIVNSDPNIVRLAMRWFYDVCGAKPENIKAFIHLYPDNDIEETLSFWSNIIKIPKSQFGKTTIDRRENKKILKIKKLPHGTLHVRVKSKNMKHLGVNLHRKIISWIEKCTSQIKL